MTTPPPSTGPSRFRFRAWDTKNKKMIVFSLGGPDSVYGYEGEVNGVVLPDQQTLLIDNSKIGRPDNPGELNPDLVLMQNTGLTDKNGREIFEGDILQMPEFYEAEEFKELKHIVDVVEWRDGLAAFCFPDGETLHDEYFAYDGKMEVIGNIYENPNLLPPRP